MTKKSSSKPNQSPKRQKATQSKLASITWKFFDLNQEKNTQFSIKAQ
jgi:hypothetical protein